MAAFLVTRFRLCGAFALFNRRKVGILILKGVKKRAGRGTCRWRGGEGVGRWMANLPRWKGRELPLYLILGRAHSITLKYLLTIWYRRVKTAQIVPGCLSCKWRRTCIVTELGSGLERLACLDKTSRSDRY